MTVSKLLPKYVDMFTDRYGVKRYYYRRKGGPRFALPGLPWSSEFMAAYAKAIDGEATAIAGRERIIAGSVAALILDYYGDGSWTDELSPSSRKFRKSILERFREQFGNAAVRAMERQHIQGVLAKLAPNAQKNWIKTLRGLFKFAATVNRYKLAIDPTRDVTLKKAIKTGGFRAWTEEDVTTYRAFYPIGTRERLAMELMLNLGVRVSDACQIGPRDIKDGMLIDYHPQKGRRTGGLAINVPLHPDLLAVIAGTNVTGTGAFVVNARGEPFDNDALSERMRTWCNAAGLPACRSHGLRKLCLTRLAEAGCSAFELRSWSGHKNLKELETYCQTADRKRLAQTAMAKLVAASGG
jgi:integrase